MSSLFSGGKSSGKEVVSITNDVTKEMIAGVIKMVKAIKDDVELGPHGKWEKVYKKICDAMNKSAQIDQGSPCSDDEMGYSVLCTEV